jgi:hypothetical protein
VIPLAETAAEPVGQDSEHFRVDLFVRASRFFGYVECRVGLLDIVNLDRRTHSAQGFAQRRTVTTSITSSLNEEHRGRRSKQDIRIALFRLVLGVQREAEQKESIGLQSIRHQSGRDSAAESDTTDEELSRECRRIPSKDIECGAKSALEHLGRIGTASLSCLGEGEVESQCEVASLRERLREQRDQRVLEIARAAMGKDDGHAITGGPPLGNTEDTAHTVASVDAFGEPDRDFLELRGRLHRGGLFHEWARILDSSSVDRRVIKILPAMPGQYISS